MKCIAVGDAVALIRVLPNPEHTRPPKTVTFLLIYTVKRQSPGF